MPILIMWGCLFYFGRHEVAAHEVSVSWLNALLCLPLLVIVHAGGNMVSDYFDHTRGVDPKGGPNGVTWIHDGTFLPKEILHYGLTLLAVAMPIGLFLLYNSSWNALWIGITGMLLSVIYPWMKAHFLGDANILASFALLPAVGTAFVATDHYAPDVLLFILPLGLLTVAILHANNTRDIDNDHRAGLKTLCVAMGLKGSKVVYTLEVLLPYVLTMLFVLLMKQPWTLLLVLLTLPLAIRNVRSMTQADTSKPHLGIAQLDKGSAQLQMVFGLLFTLGYFAGGWLGI